MKAVVDGKKVILHGISRKKGKPVQDYPIAIDLAVDIRPRMLMWLVVAEFLWAVGLWKPSQWVLKRTGCVKVNAKR